MSDKGNSQKAATPAKAPRSGWWVRFIANEKRKAQQRKTQKKKESAADRAGRRTANATYCIAGFTVILAVTSYLQWREIHTGNDDTHKLAESTLAASRAWIGVQGTGFGFTKDKDFPSARVILEDSGNSPAFGVNGWRCVEVRSEEPPLKGGHLQRSLTAICLPIAAGTVGKGVPITMNAYIPALAPTDFATDTEGVGPRFYYWGVVNYRIYPDDGIIHSTEFCLKNGGDQLSACREGGFAAN